MIDSRLLQDALILSKHRNFARAAKELNISQPTLSRRIQLLEKVIGERLFDRASRTILPTRAGEIILKHARIIISSSEAMQEEIGRYRGLLEGSLYIGAGPYPAVALLSPVIGQFSERYPGINIKITVGDWTKFSNRLMQEDFDYVLMETSQLDVSRDFELIRLNRHPGFFFCRFDHPLLKKSGLTIRDLSQFPVIFTVLPRRLLNLLSNLFRPGENPDVSATKLQNISSNDLATMKATVSNSNSIGIGTYGTLASELEAGLFVALPFRIPELRTDYDIVKRKGLSLSMAALELIDLLVETDKEQSILEAGLIESLGPETVY